LIAPVCFVVRDMNASSSPFMSFSASHRSKDPFSRAPAIMPLGWSAVAGAQAMSWNLRRKALVHACHGVEAVTLNLY